MNDSRRLEAIGFFELCHDLCDALLPPLKSLFPWLQMDRPLERHHSFAIRYIAGQSDDKHVTDLSLNSPLPLHEDDALITVNLCLKDCCQGGEVLLGPAACDAHASASKYVPANQLRPVQHVAGKALIHLGCQAHGANSISSGERHNVIMGLRCGGNSTQSYGEAARTTLAKLPCKHMWCTACSLAAVASESALRQCMPKSVMHRSGCLLPPLPKEVAHKILECLFGGRWTSQGKSSSRVFHQSQGTSAMFCT